MPFTGAIRGSDADPAGGFLYIAYGGDGGWHGTDSLLNWNLITDSAEWKRSYPFGVGSARVLRGTYLHADRRGNRRQQDLGDFRRRDGRRHRLADRRTKPHNTICYGGNVYMGPRSSRYLFTSDATKRQIGPCFYDCRKEGCFYDCRKEGWILHSRDGGYVFVGEAGDVIDTPSRTVIATLPALTNDRHGFHRGRLERLRARRHHVVALRRRSVGAYALGLAGDSGTGVELPRDSLRRRIGSSLAGRSCVS